MPLVGYWIAAALLGAVPFALLLGFLRKVDLRDVGSGNPGATNLYRTLGWQWGLAAFLLDAGKGFLPIWLGQAWWPDAPWLVLLGGGLAVLGHCYSPFIGFRGGKGVATSIGIVIALDPLLSAVLLLVWILFLAILRDVGIASTLGALAGAAVGGWRWATLGMDSPQGPLAVLLVALAPLIVLRHRQNILGFFSSSKKEVEA